ncbi:MAG TPA: LodA/GoxA family CTQ-dependent oxidase, partial [Longimicrobium sp.]|nr:LodA/GoxA family CTQ-dependent oxidase [Longimicrobium sp.]
MDQSHQPQAAPPADQQIVRAAIHPAIGIARVGNSQDEYFYGPEVVHPLPEQPGFYKDGTGALKRQAALFRVYGYNAAGQVVAELTADNADIRWTAHVANTKAAWYEFQIALDIPEAATAPPSNLRNADVKGAARGQLSIDPGPRSITGRSQQGEQYAFDSGEFFGTPVYLGELRTDEAGRLVFLGGRGVSASRDGKPAVTFANNDGWHDDVSDGPVTAQVTVGGRELPVDPAWVVTAPPNYAPDVITVRTLHDLLYDVFVADGEIAFPAAVSFTRHVWPVLSHLTSLEWVNAGFAAQFGWGGPNHFADPGLVRRLSSKPATPGAFDPNAELRRQVLNSFRLPHPTDMNPLPWPWIYGDAMNIPADSPRQHVSISPTQYRFLQLWADGQFIDDWDPARPVPHRLDEVPLREQPAMLDQAATHFCLADAFHPGCEMTWPVRHASMYSAPYRIRHRPAGTPEPSYGPTLTPEIALRPGGPLYAQGPGDISRWMAVPWQTDTASCRSGYEPDYDPYLPTFWPARVPNQVLTLEDYRKVVDASLPPEERFAAFSRRLNWLRVLSSNYKKAINEMVADFGKLGVVEVREGVTDDPAFPRVMMVESQPGMLPRQIPFAAELLKTIEIPADVAASADAAVAAVEAAAPDAAARGRRLEQAGFESEEDLAEMVAEL